MDTQGDLEWRLLELMAGGLNSAEVAAQAGLPVEIVRAQLEEAMSRLGARTKLEAILIASQRGLIALPVGRR